MQFNFQISIHLIIYKRKAFTTLLLFLTIAKINKFYQHFFPSKRKITIQNKKQQIIIFSMTFYIYTCVFKCSTFITSKINLKILCLSLFFLQGNGNSNMTLHHCQLAAEKETCLSTVANSSAVI